MIKHPKIYFDRLEDSETQAIVQASIDILSRVGIRFQSAKACEYLAKAGASVDFSDNLIKIPEDLIAAALSNTPQSWTLQARNSKRNIRVGSKNLFLCPGYGSPFVVDNDGYRRYAKLKDFQNFALLAGTSDMIDITGSLQVFRL